MTAHNGFRIGFDVRDTPRVLAAWESILTSRQWAEGPYIAEFERRFRAWAGRDSVAFSGWAGGALACLAYYRLRGRKVLVPANTFMATPLAVLNAGATPVFGDCRRDDLCLSADAVRAGLKAGVAAVFVVHIGGHVAFDIDEIAGLCARAGVPLIEDCAHAMGAAWDGARPGSWGDAAVFSFYATKTISTGEGGMLTSNDAGLIGYAREFRNYGKPTHQVLGLNYRMNEFTAALGAIQMERLEEIVAAKRRYAAEVLDPVEKNRIRFPAGMRSGYYKYIVLEGGRESTGRVYDTPCHTILGIPADVPGAGWIAANHSCLPIYYHGGVA